MARSTFESSGEAIIKGAMLGMEAFGYKVMNQSLQQAPIESGTLRRSAKVNPAENTGTRLRLVMGYGYGDEVNPQGKTAADYAVPVHEIMEKKHPPPTKSHFLIDPLLENSKLLEPYMAGMARYSVEGKGTRVAMVFELQDVEPVK